MSFKFWVLFCPLRFPHKTMFDSSLLTVDWICLCIVVSITYYVVSLLCLSSSCVLCIVVSITYYVVSLLCLSSSCVLCIVVSITYYVVSLLCLSSSCVLCIVVSITYYVVSLCCLSSSCVSNIACFSFLDYPLLIVPSVLSDVYYILLYFIRSSSKI
jgi:hypothetical protein